MTLLLTILAAVIATIIWYINEKARRLKIGMLCYMFWGASIMWLCDAIFEYLDKRAAYFTPALEDMINDTYLGICVIALALVIWVIVILIKDPLGTVANNLKNKKIK